MTPARVLLPVGWVVASTGYFGPWIAHKTAAMAISGVDMGEFVKFLPGVLDGSLKLVRQSFYLPPFVVVASVALLVGLRRLRYPWLLRVLILLLAVPVSLQLFPPAWSPGSLMTAEFRLQTIALGTLWMLLAGFWVLGRLPPGWVGILSIVLSLAAAGLSAWQFLLAKSAIDAVYHAAPSIGWGFLACFGGLLVMAAGSVILVLRTQGRELWSGE